MYAEKSLRHEPQGPEDLLVGLNSLLLTGYSHREEP